MTCRTCDRCFTNIIHRILRKESISENVLEQIFNKSFLQIFYNFKIFRPEWHKKKKEIMTTPLCCVKKFIFALGAQAAQKTLYAASWSFKKGRKQECSCKPSDSRTPNLFNLGIVKARNIFTTRNTV